MDPRAAFASATLGDGTALPDRQRLEALFGEDLSTVRLYLGAVDPLAVIGARAATRGEKIAFADGTPSPAMLTHEVAHVIQQRRAGLGPAAVGPSGAAAELEAEYAAQAAPGTRVHIAARPEAEILCVTESDIPGEHLVAWQSEVFQEWLVQYFEALGAANHTSAAHFHTWVADLPLTTALALLTMPSQAAAATLAPSLVTTIRVLVESNYAVLWSQALGREFNAGNEPDVEIANNVTAVVTKLLRDAKESLVEEANLKPLKVLYDHLWPNVSEEHWNQIVKALPHGQTPAHLDWSALPLYPNRGEIAEIAAKCQALAASGNRVAARELAESSGPVDAVRITYAWRSLHPPEWTVLEIDTARQSLNPETMNNMLTESAPLHAQANVTSKVRGTFDTTTTWNIILLIDDWVSVESSTKKGLLGFFEKKYFAFCDTHALAVQSLWKPGGPTVNDVVQRRLGDCYLLSALMSLVRSSPKYVESMFVLHGNDVSVRLYDDNDDEKWIRLSPTLVQSEKKPGPKFSGLPEAAWPGLIEKAYAVCFGQSNYARIAGGMSDSAMRHLTGKTSDKLALKDMDGSEVIAAIQAFSKGKTLLTIGSKEEKLNQKYTKAHPQLAGFHVYELVYPVVDSHLTLHNPHNRNHQHEAPQFQIDGATVAACFDTVYSS